MSVLRRLRQEEKSLRPCVKKIKEKKEKKKKERKRLKGQGMRRNSKGRNMGRDN